MKRSTKYFGVIVLAVIMLVSLCACVERKDETIEYSYYVYCLDQEQEGLTSVGYQGEETDGMEMARHFLSELQKERKEESLVNPIPNNVSINGFNIIEKVLTVDFSESYYYQTPERELLSRAAIVLTLSQIDGVRYVSFTVNGNPLTIDGEIVEAMDASSFSSDLSGDDSVKSSDSFILYYANEDGSALKKYKIQRGDYSGMSKEEYVVRKLISGPTKSGYTPTLPEKVQLNDVTTVDNICYVDFGEDFLTKQSVVSNKLVIYSIVNSLLELTDVQKVQMTVNGKSDIFYHEDISLKKPMERNLDLIED